MKDITFFFLLLIAFNVKSQVHDDMYGKFVEKEKKNIFKSSINGDKFISGYEKLEKYNEDTYIVHNPFNLVTPKKN